MSTSFPWAQTQVPLLAASLWQVSLVACPPCTARSSPGLAPCPLAWRGVGGLPGQARHRRRQEPVRLAANGNRRFLCAGHPVHRVPGCSCAPVAQHAPSWPQQARAPRSVPGFPPVLSVCTVRCWLGPVRRRRSCRFKAAVGRTPGEGLAAVVRHKYASSTPCELQQQGTASCGVSYPPQYTRTSTKQPLSWSTSFEWKY